MNRTSNTSFISQWEYMNPNYRSSMEDVSIVDLELEDNSNVSLIALLDGHGGCAAASFVSAHLGKNLCEALQIFDFNTFEDAIRYAFYYTDMECRMQNLMASGCTCAALIIVFNEETRQRTIYSANIGDSRIVLYSSGVVTRLSYDHKAEDKQEIARIISAGGMVMNKRVMGLLGVTRSFGDNSIKEFVIAEPYISSMIITPECNFAVIGCDGVFDVLTDEDVCTVVKQCIQQNNSQNCARLLVEEALHRDSRDNISAIVIGFSFVCYKIVIILSSQTLYSYSTIYFDASFTICFTGTNSLTNEVPLRIWIYLV